MEVQPGQPHQLTNATLQHGRKGYGIHILNDRLSFFHLQAFFLLSPDFGCKVWELANTQGILISPSYFPLADLFGARQWGRPELFLRPQITKLTQTSKGSQSYLRFPPLPHPTTVQAEFGNHSSILESSQHLEKSPASQWACRHKKQNDLQEIAPKYSLQFLNLGHNGDCVKIRSVSTQERKSVYCVHWGPLFCMPRNFIHSVSRLSQSLVSNQNPSPKALYLPVESGIVHGWVAGLKLPGFEFLAFSMSLELYLHRPLTQFRHRFSLRSVAELIGLYPPGLSKVIHIKLEVSISTN